MVYRKLIIKPLAAIEIEEAILSYLSFNLDLEKNWRKKSVMLID
jgi:hypothetical protein